MTDAAPLLRRSVEVIRAGQAPSGAYVACPSFPPYAYAWLRDGAFVADAMSRVGEVASAEAWFDWVAGLVGAGKGFHARYTLAGERDESAWPHRQHDGWGLWLWALAAHCDRHGRGRGRWDRAAGATCDHLEDVWDEPCVDWWEERVGLHAATLACLAGGLAAWGRPPVVDRSLAEQRLDASLLCLAWPFGLDESVPAAVEQGLVSPGGGVHRHREDEYYGGGEWLLLVALLGLCRGTRGDRDGAADCLRWVAAHATETGELPEQSQDHLLRPERYGAWVERWGPPPSPLLWSHAMFIDLASSLGQAG